MSGAPGVDPRFARSVQRWLIAYPPRWRRVRAGEITAVLADLAAPGAVRLDVRSGLGLLRAGAATRHRMAPPLRMRMKYLGLDWPLPAPYRPWVDDQLRSPVQGQGLVTTALLLSIMWGVPVALGQRPVLGVRFMVAYAVLLVTVSTTRFPGWWRTQALRHLTPQRGERPVPGWYVPGLVYHQRLGARAGANLAAVLVLVTTGVGAACLVPGGRLAHWQLAVPLLLGFVPAIVGSLRWRRGTSRLPAQPGRLVGAASSRQRWGTALWALSFVVVVIGAATGRQWWVAYLVLGAALPMLPWVLAAWALTRRAVPDGLALVDLRDLTVRRHVQVDEPLPGPVLWAPDGAWAGPSPETAPSGVAPA